MTVILAVIVCLSRVEFGHASPILLPETTGRRSRRTGSGFLPAAFTQLGHFVTEMMMMMQ